MTTHIRLRNIGQMVLHGRHPGEEWLVEADDAGRAVNQLWRKRLYDEEKYKVGVLAIVGTEVASQSSPEPDTSRIAPVPDIGPFLDLFGKLGTRVESLEQKPAPVIPTFDPSKITQDYTSKINDLNKRVAALERIIQSAINQ